MSVSSIKSRARGFVQAYKWLLSDFVSRAGRVLTQVTLLACVFIAFRIFVFSVVVQLIKSIDYAFLAGQRDLEVYPGYPLGLVEAAALAWCLVMVTATAGYLFYRSVFTSTHEHMHGLFERLLEALGSRPVLGRPLPALHEGNTKVLTQVTTHVRLVNILSRILLFSIFESLSFVICLALLFWLHAPTTLVLLVAGLVFMPLYYLLSLEGIRNRRKLKPANRELADALREFEGAVTTPGAQTSQVVRSFAKDTRIGTAFKLFQVQRMIVFKSEYAGWFLLASIAVICVFWIHYLSLQTVRISDWYFGVFLVMMYSLVRSLRSIVSSNRFLDSAIFCNRVLEPYQTEVALAPQKGALTLQFNQPGEATLDIAPGQIVLIESVEGSNMFAAGAAAAQLSVKEGGALGLGLLPFDANAEDIAQARAAGLVPLFEAPDRPDLTQIPEPLADLALQVPLLILVRKRLGKRLIASAPDLVLTVAGTQVVRHWHAGLGTPLTPFVGPKGRAKEFDADLDDEEFM